MTQTTLTSEQLRALRDALKSWRDGYDPVDDKEPYEMFVAAESAVAELLANREAQPVVTGENCWSCGKFFTYAQHSECDGYCPHCDAPVDLDEGEEDATPLAPRVTAIPEAATLTNINQLCPLGNNLIQTDFATGWNDCRQYALTHDALPPVIKGVHAAAQGWNACRAAMLEPVIK
ncbi:hypothetical protein AAY84_12130 [Serratia marcescens]|uniref:hypothetical protein n=1 Tax=Serratia marcescens TaxID=615 RepID=UPI00062C219E|nr:hypothetical protein [Serratia marcescens]KKZ18095.1 hypothetical protein AAY84_12130 [Serratia marcescens]